MKSVFHDDNTKLSFSRLICFILVMCYVVGFLYILFTKQQLADVPLQLAGLITLLYGTNKVSSVIQSKNFNK